MLLLSAHFLVVAPEGKICCIQIELIFLGLEKLGGIIVHAPSVLFYDKYKVLLELLERTIESPQGWDDASISQVSGIYHFVNSFCFAI